MTKLYSTIKKIIYDSYFPAINGQKNSQRAAKRICALLKKGLDK